MYTPNPDAPALINHLAEQAGKTAFAWRETEELVVLVFTDGEKVRFEREQVGEEPTAEINLADGVDDAEAATAGRALSARRKKKE